MQQRRQQQSKPVVGTPPQGANLISISPPPSIPLFSNTPPSTEASKVNRRKGTDNFNNHITPVNTASINDASTRMTPKKTLHRRGRKPIESEAKVLVNGPEISNGPHIGSLFHEASIDNTQMVGSSFGGPQHSIASPDEWPFINPTVNDTSMNAVGRSLPSMVNFDTPPCFGPAMQPPTMGNTDMMTTPNMNGPGYPASASGRPSMMLAPMPNSWDNPPHITSERIGTPTSGPSSSMYTTPLKSPSAMAPQASGKQNPRNRPALPYANTAPVTVFNSPSGSTDQRTLEGVVSQLDKDKPHLVNKKHNIFSAFNRPMNLVPPAPTVPRVEPRPTNISAKAPAFIPPVPKIGSPSVVKGESVAASEVQPIVAEKSNKELVPQPVVKDSDIEIQKSTPTTDFHPTSSQVVSTIVPVPEIRPIQRTLGNSGNRNASQVSAAHLPVPPTTAALASASSLPSPMARLVTTALPFTSALRPAAPISSTAALSYTAVQSVLEIQTATLRNPAVLQIPTAVLQRVPNVQRSALPNTEAPVTTIVQPVLIAQATAVPIELPYIIPKYRTPYYRPDEQKSRWGDLSPLRDIVFSTGKSYTDSLSTTQLLNLTLFMCSKMNWDFITSNTEKVLSGMGAKAQWFWGDALALYNHYCDLAARERQYEFFETLARKFTDGVDDTRVLVQVINGIRQVVDDMIVLFVRGNDLTQEAWTRGREAVEIALCGGNIDNLAKERFAEIGLEYKCGTGDTEKHIQLRRMLG